MKEKSYVSILPVDDKIQVEWSYQILMNPAKDGKFSCYIPSFGIYYTSISEEEIGKKSEALTKMYFDNFFDGGPKWRLLAIQLKKLGFRAPKNDYVLKEMLNNRFIRARFKSEDGNIPSNFSDATRTEHKSELELAY